MAHPQMFDDDDPELERFRTIALSLPEAKEKVSHGRPTFFTKKVFAYFGAARKDASGEIVQMYLGPTGWIGLDAEQLSDEELYDLVADSYRNTAPARLAMLIDD